MSDEPTERDVEALADSIAVCFSNVSHLPEWMQVPALGRDMRPLTVIAARAVLRSDWYAERIAEARREGAALGRRAILDPGAFVKRGADYDGNAYGERLDQWQARATDAALRSMTTRIASLPGTSFRCAECQREVRTDNEVVTCAHGDDPTCDPCCEAYHGVPHPVGGGECRETAREKAISQGDE